MKVPNFSVEQFVDAIGPGGLNVAFGTVSGALSSVVSGAWAIPGFLAPEAIGVTFAGMTVTTTIPMPCQLITSGGIAVRAHGTVTNQDTNSYSNSFASLVPGGGSVTARLVASVVQIQQNPVPVPGPPLGHPSYNPNFIPSVGYASQVYSLALTATTGAVDNVNTFEVFRTTLTAGQSSITAVSPIGQQRASDRKGWPLSVLASGGALLPSQAQSILAPATTGLTTTLPGTSSAGGLVFGLVNPTAGNWTIATTGSDVIVGSTPSSSVSSILIPPSGAALLWCYAPTGAWFVIGTSNNAPPHGRVEFSSSGAWVAPPGVTQTKSYVWGAGAGGGGVNGNAQASGASGGGYSEGEYTVVPGTSYPITVGVAGTGGTGVPTNGSSGGTSSFASFNSATGGGPGFASSSGPQATVSAGGIGIGGSLNLQGGPGAGAFGGGGGAGGGAPFGGAGAAAGALNGASPGLTPGGGGGGAGGLSGGFAGGLGGGGMVVLEW